MRMRLGHPTTLAIGLLVGLSVPAAVRAAEPVAVLTEIRPGQGEVRVKLAGEAQWKAPQPLLSLRPGDQVRASADARAVLVFTGGRAPESVTAANSPFAVAAPSGAAGGQRVQALVDSVTQFLVGKQDKPAYVSLYVPLSTRSVRLPPPTLLAPRETRLLFGPVTFEWSGSDRLRYMIRLFGPDGLVWEEGGLVRQPVLYPATAPALRPGLRYAWELHTERQPVQRAEFEILPPADARRVQQALALLVPSALPGQSGSTLALLRAGFLSQEGLYQEARKELLAAIAADATEPSLHQLLGHVYDRMGMKDLATDAFDEARFLATPRP
ncbi:MAG: hypothetical protein HYV93_05655 [Candidatus Rokubacteria bacterium]|nr:hypothetical protein [Candidatus Rokubacteria bacterium]